MRIDKWAISQLLRKIKGAALQTPEKVTFWALRVSPSGLAAGFLVVGPYLIRRGLKWRCGRQMGDDVDQLMVCEESTASSSLRKEGTSTVGNPTISFWHAGACWD